ncbi:cathelicidin-related peptide Oh-Cath-like [Python bivittatus]|uniref:Vipericidin n=1 Tax=Python bivittatus TaxID=176946 RepID=A0A2R3YZX8_PYTBI|nr:cathelicidin-related peptide Oh-Cath-like [Python bivittatus]AVR43560.1 CATH2 [Python bivittatus]
MEIHPGRILLVLSLVVRGSVWAVEGEILSYDAALSLAVNLYNQESGWDVVFQLLEAKPQPEWDPSSKARQKLDFTLKETTCPTSQNLNLEVCDFKEQGVVVECSGSSLAQPGAPIIQFSCETATQGNHRVKRNGFRKFMRRLKKFFAGGGSSIAHIKLH